MKEIATLFVLGIVLYGLKCVLVIVSEIVIFRSRARKGRKENGL